MKPITPQEALEDKDIPDFIIEAFNILLKQETKPGSSSVVLKLKDVKQQIKVLQPSKMEALDRNPHWLDIEPLYSKAGWTVTFESPSYGDTDFDAYYCFRIKRVIK